MFQMKLTTLVVIAILATLTFEVVEGKCQVACLISMLKCARTADARQEKLGSTIAVMTTSTVWLHVEREEPRKFVILIH